MNKQDEIIDRCVAFAVRINNLRRYLKKEQHEHNHADQIQRSGSSIGANYSEACCAESKIDFVHKLGIAHKEAKETQYWLRVLYGSEFITKEMYDSLSADLETILKILTASIKTAKSQLSK